MWRWERGSGERRTGGRDFWIQKKNGESLDMGNEQRGLWGLGRREQREEWGEIAESLGEENIYQEEMTD